MYTQKINKYSRKQPSVALRKDSVSESDFYVVWIRLYADDSCPRTVKPALFRTRRCN